MISKLVKGLQREGFHVSVVPLVQANLLAKLYSDMADLKKLRGFDAVIYMGSIPWPSHILISDDTLVALFVHGFVRQELINVMKLRRFKAGPLLSLSLWSISKSIGRIDLFICHSHTSCEANGIRERFVLLPQFVFPEEVELYSELKKSFEEDSGTNCERFKVVTYASFATSPRLLTQPYVLTLMREVSKRVKKEVELVMIDPKMREGRALGEPPRPLRQVLAEGGFLEAFGPIGPVHRALHRRGARAGLHRGSVARHADSQANAPQVRRQTGLPGRGHMVVV